MREAGRVFRVYQEPRWQDPGWGVGGHGIADMAAGGKMMMADQLHKAGDPEAESAHPVRTPAEPDKMADSAAALKARDKEVTKRGILLLTSPLPTSLIHTFLSRVPFSKTL